MSLKIDRVQLDIIINNDPARQQLRKLEEEFKLLAAEQKKFTSGTDDYHRLHLKMMAVKGKMDEIYQSIGIGNLSLRELRQRQTELNAVLSHMSPSMKGYAELKAQATEISARLTELRGKAQTTGTAITSSFGGLQAGYAKMIGYGAAIMGVVYSLKKLYDAAEEQEKADRRLMEAVKGNIGVFNELKKQQDELRNATGIDDEEIAQIQMMGTEAGLTTEDVKKLTEASINLSSITGKDLQSTYMSLMRTMAGNRKGIAFLGKDFTDLTLEQLKHGEAVDLVIKKYGGMAAASALAGDKVKTNWHEVLETLGGALMKVVGPMLEMTNSFMKAVNPAKSMVETLTNERDTLNSLVYQIQDTNTNQAQRNKLIDELRIKYPEFLGNLSNEQVTNEKLAQSLLEVNTQYTNKIRLANSEKTLMALATVQQNATDKLNEAERKRNEILASSMKLLYDSNPPAAALVEKASSLAEKVKLVNKYWGAGGGTTGTAGQFLAAANEAEKAEKIMKAAQVDFSSGSLKIAEDAVNSSLNTTNSLESVSTEILNIAVRTNDQLTKQIVQAELYERAHKPKATIKLTDEEAAKAAEEAKKAEDAKLKAEEEAYKLHQDIEKQAIESSIALMQDGTAKELAELQRKYEAERTNLVHQLTSNKKLTVDEKDKLNQVIANLDQKYLDDQGKLDKDSAEQLLQFDKELNNLKLASVIEGSDEEFKLKQDIIENNRKLELAGIKETGDQKIALEKAINDKYNKELKQLQETKDLGTFSDNFYNESSALVKSFIEKRRIIKQDFDAGKINKRQYNDELFALDAQYEKDILALAIKEAQGKLDILKATGIASVKELQQAQAALDEALKKASDASTGKGKNTDSKLPAKGFGDMSDEELQAYALNAAKTVADGVFQIERDNNQRILDDKINKLESQREKELSNKNLTEAQKEAINKKFDAKERALKQEAWKKQHQADIVQSIVSGALGILTGLAQGGIPGAILAGAVAAFEIITVASQKMPQFYEGGFTDKDTSNKTPAGIVHANEYVIPAEGVKNPKFAPLLNTIEQARKKGTLGTLNPSGEIPGFEKGGPTDANAITYGEKHQLEFFMKGFVGKIHAALNPNDTTQNKVLLKLINTIDIIKSLYSIYS
jgi:hypothetical protein